MKIIYLLIGLALCGTHGSSVMALDVSKTPPAEFQLTVTGGDPLYRISVPDTVYQLIRTNNLQDINITNGNGEQVPYAVLAYRSLHPDTIPTQTRQVLNFYTIEESRLNEGSAINIELEKQANRTTVNIRSDHYKPPAKPVYLLDRGEKPEPLQNLTLDWQGGDNRLIPLEILGSDNLKDWTKIEQIVLLKSRQNGKAIVHNTVTFPYAVKSRYLQLRPSRNGSEEFKLTKAETHYQAEEIQAPPYQWTSLKFLDRQQNDDGITNLTFEAGRRYPVSQLKIALPEENTITGVRLSTRNTEKESWHYLTSAALYRVLQNGRSMANPGISIPETVARFWQLQFDRSNGGIGKDNPTVAAGWLPHTLVWNARGKGPFKLTAGNNPHQTSHVAITGLIPGYDAQKVLNLPEAALASPAIAGTDSGKPTNTWLAEPDYKRWLLWAGLILGVTLLAMMAYSLLRGNGHGQKK